MTTEPSADKQSALERSANRRIRASSLCSTSFHLGWLSWVTLFLPCLGAWPLSIAAAFTGMLCGLIGLVRLGRRAERPSTPLQRVAHRMSSRAKHQGHVGLLLGLVSSIIHLWILRNV